MTLGLLAAGVAFAGELAVSAYWQDHMVLQRGKPITVWGKDAAGRAVTIAFAGQTAAAVAGDDGFWETTFAQPFAISAAPRTLTISDDAGEVISLADILVGDVFLAAGQSNMDRRLDDVVKSYHEPRAVKEFCRDDDGIRFIRIARSAEKTDGKEQLFDLPPHKAVNDKIKYFGEGYDWSPATGTNRNYVSSLALNFARYIRDANAAKGQDIPIGIVHASSGGTAIRQWLSAAALGANGYAAEPTDGCLTRLDDMEFGQRLSLYNGEGLPMSPLPPMDVEDADPGAKTSTAVADKEPNIPSAPPIPEPLWSMGPYDPSAWKPLAHNLLAAKTGVTTGNLAWAPVSKELANLTDGAVPGTPDNGRIVGFCPGSAVSWDFDEPQTIEQIRISTRCGENNNTQFSGLRIEDVYVRKSGSPDWEPLGVPMYQKGGPAKGAMVAILADDGIGRLADNVVGLKIVFGQGEGYAHYLAEIEVSGHAERFGFVFSWGCVSNEEDARAYAAIGVTDIFAKGAEGYAAAKRHGLRTYCGFGPHGNGRQGLTPEQQKHFDYLSATNLRKQKMNGKELDTIVNARLGTAKCQFGGEPVSSPDLCPDLIDCFLGDTDCVKSFGALEKTLMENQEADGIAFDYIGYTNLRSCECDGCKARLAAWLAENGLEENEVSRNRFFREGLVNYINALVT